MYCTLAQELNQPISFLHAQILMMQVLCYGQLCREMRSEQLLRSDVLVNHPSTLTSSTHRLCCHPSPDAPIIINAACRELCYLIINMSFWGTCTTDAVVLGRTVSFW